MTNLITELTQISPRRGLGEQQAANIIKNYLKENSVEYVTQEFQCTIPNIIKAELFADDKNIPCIGASFVSGKIDINATIVNAFGPDIKKSQIIFNPVSEGICLQTYKDYPAIAVNRDSIIELTLANTIRGEVLVEPFEFESQNILVGNLENPTKITFAHYDSIVGAGAIDNAGSVGVIMQTLVENPALLKDNLFVFIGCEEESISSKEGLYGFKQFDKTYRNILKTAKEIIVIDGVGITEPKIVSDHIDWVFSLNVEDKEIIAKTFWMQNDQTKVMKYYHTVLDTHNLLETEHLNHAKELLISVL